MNETAQRLMDLAEGHIRHAGYRGFSFRELAAELGIKSASVHHHFPTKATLAAAVVRRYADDFSLLLRRGPMRRETTPSRHTDLLSERLSSGMDGCASAACLAPRRAF